MGAILPGAIRPTVTAQTPTQNTRGPVNFYNNGQVDWSALLSDTGDILRGIGSQDPDSFGKIISQRETQAAAQQQRATEAQRYQDQLKQQQREIEAQHYQDALKQQQRAIEAQHYQDTLKQQQFSNNLALQTLQIKAATAAGKGQNLDTAAPTAVFGDTRAVRPVSPGVQPVTAPPSAQFLPVAPNASISDIPTPMPKSSNPVTSNLGPVISELSQLQGTAGPRSSVAQVSAAPGADTFNSNAANKIAMGQPLKNAPNSTFMQDLVTAISPIGSASAASAFSRGLNTIGSAAVAPTQTNAPTQPVTRMPAEPFQIITPGTIPDHLKAAYTQFDTYHPELAENALRVANYQLPMSELNKLVAKQYKDPQEVQAVQRLVHMINPDYNPEMAQKIQQVQQNINNPRSPDNADLKSLSKLAVVNLQQRQYAARVPSISIPLLNRPWVTVNRWAGQQDLSRFDQGADAENKELERWRLGGRPTVSSLKTISPLYDASLGPRVLTASYDAIQKGIDRDIYNKLYQASIATRGYGGYRNSDLNPVVLQRLKDEGYIGIGQDGRLVLLKPAVTSTQ